MIGIALMTVSALVLLTLGVLHLVYTFSGPKLMPRDPALQARMNEVPLVITRRTTMWRAWIGFNASHSMGAILFGLVYGFLAKRSSRAAVQLAVPARRRRRRARRPGRAREALLVSHSVRRRRDIAGVLRAEHRGVARVVGVSA